MRNKLFNIFIILFVSANLFAVEQSKTSFSSSLKIGLEKIGVTNSFNEISVLMGTAFVPAIVPETACFFSGIEKADDKLLEKLVLGSGIECDTLEINSRSWNQAIVRQYFRRLIIESFLKTNIALVQGGWDFSDSNYDWGIVERIDENKTFYGKVNGKSVRLTTAPKKLLVISVSDNLDFNKIKINLLRYVIKLLNNINKDEDLLTGIAALNYFGNLIYRQPFCLHCNRSDSLCAEKFLEKYSENLQQGINYLASLENQNNHLTNTINEFLIILKNLKEMETNFTDLETRLKLDEKIKKLNSSQRRAAAYLALYCDIPGPVTKPKPEFHIEKNRKILVNFLPLYQDMTDGEKTFLCSVLMAGQVAGIERNLDWINFCSAIPFKFLIDRKTFLPPKDVLTGIDSSKGLFDSMNYGFIKYYYSTKTSKDVKKFIYQKIKKSIDMGYPLIISSSNGWGILAGYFGDNFICRFPDDSKDEFTYIKNIPEEIFVFDKKNSKMNLRKRIKLSLRKIIEMNEITNAGSFVSGIAGLDYWINICSYYAEKGINPSKKFAKANYKLWTKLLEERRAAYSSLIFIIYNFPELSIPFGFVKENYLEEINLLKCGLVDNIVLNFKNEKFTKPDWLHQNAKKQIEVLKKIRNLEKENLLHFKIALKQLDINI